MSIELRNHRSVRPVLLAGCAALVEGRGETVTPLAGVRGPRPGVLLVTPAVALGTSDVFAAYAAGLRPTSPGASRTSSEHLAAELRSGLGSAILVSRSAVIAASNDLLPASLALVPGLRAFRRALTRVVGRPVGQSGSGPTCFVLYASVEEARAAAMEVERAVGDGRLPGLGDDAPTVIVTTVEGTPDATAPGREAGRNG